MTATTTAKRTTPASRPDVYARVTDSIVAHLEQGVRPWVRPWNADHAAGRVALPRRHSGEPYRGINILLLWAETMTKGFAQPVWMTYRQAEALHAHVRRGERGSLVVYADRCVRTGVDAHGEELETEFPFLKAYTVFNVEQIEGLPDTYYTSAPQPSTRLPPIDAAEAFLAATGATIRHAGHQAYYSPSADVVVLPPPESFLDAEAYAATKAHELTHWTKHPTRLDRNLGGTRVGDEGYAREELVAELGAAFLCSELGVTAEPREDHAAYLAHWLRILKADKRAILQAAAHAQKAMDYLRSLQPASGDEPDRP
jgi:antirestriction protein ArdC